MGYFKGFWNRTSSLGDLKIMTIKIQSFGATEGVTGSCHLLQVGKVRILVDCGMFQV